jgi:hypothetical protein
VPAPRAGRARARLIVAMGASLEEAAAAAEAQWQQIWRGLSRKH